MHPRHTTTLLLAALLTSGCMAVPHDPAPASSGRPAGLAPAADRPPAPLPTWPEPTQPAPREELTVTGPRPGAVPVQRGGVTHDVTPAERPGPGRNARGDASVDFPERGTQPRKRPPTTTGAGTRKKTKPVKTSTRRTAPKAQTSKKQQRPAVRRQQPAAGQPDMRQLCREAGRINAPMGAADLCRSTYGR
ncbi:hypothetical protein [Streptomyces sp. NPDC002057]|uniref:hypothetical protein n=1 Tax=Streptomyces sp. NPDC002057 TaxID=3154664 RepID=UPI00331CCBF4